MVVLRIKEIAKKKGMTMGHIAKRLGISPVNLSNSLNGNPTLNRLQEVANILEVPISDLFVNDTISKIHGFIEIDGTIHKVDSITSLKRILREYDIF